MADYIRPTPRSPILGLLADALTGGVEWMRDPRRAQQMQGLGGLLAETGIPAVVERLSYGEPLTTGRGMTTRLRPEAEAALMTLGPEAVPIGRGAMAAARAAERGVMAAGRAGERIAERVVPQVMERGGLPAQMLEGMASQTVSPLTVYHGSPYRFQRFNPTKIGSGEGAQAYGYGHYVAESPAVADQYRVALSYDPEKMKVGGRQINEVYSQIERSAARLPPAKAQAEYEKLDLLERLMMNTNLPDVRAAAAEMSPATKNWFEKTVAPSFQTYGSLYTIDLPDPAIARMLDWDKPLSEQPENVREALKVLDPYVSKSGEKMWSELAYPGFASTPTESPRAAAQWLRQQGIPGIRYLDQGSRGAGQGTSNFVIFPGEEDLLRILSVNGGLLGP